MSAILLALFLLPTAYFQLLIASVFALAAWEWADLSGLSSPLQRWGYAAVVALVTLLCADMADVIALFKLGIDVDLRDIVGLGGLWWALALLWVMSYPGSSALWGSTPVRLAMGLLVIIPAAIALMFALSLKNGQWMFLYIVGIVSCADIGAYFAGRKFGKAKLAPNVSPGKSWAGFYGGVVAVALFATMVAFTTSLSTLPPVKWVAITIIASLASVLGDLLESMIKRHRGVKDSSQLLPGHGGIMDRVDSVTAAAPVFILLFVLMGGHSLNAQLQSLFQ